LVSSVRVGRAAYHIEVTAVFEVIGEGQDVDGVALFIEAHDGFIDPLVAHFKKVGRR